MRVLAISGLRPGVPVSLDRLDQARYVPLGWWISRFRDYRCDASSRSNELLVKSAEINNLSSRFNCTVAVCCARTKLVLHDDAQEPAFICVRRRDFQCGDCLDLGQILAIIIAEMTFIAGYLFQFAATPCRNTKCRRRGFAFNFEPTNKLARFDVDGIGFHCVPQLRDPLTKHE